MVAIGIADRAKTLFLGFGIFGGLFLSSVMIGWLATSGNPLFVVIPTAILIGLFVASRFSWLFWAAVYGGLVVSGVTRLYVPALEQVRWLLAPVAILLLAHVLVRNLGSRPTAAMTGIPSVLWWAFAFILAALVSSIVNGFQLDRFVIGFKGYFQVWPLLFAMALIAWPAGMIERLPKALFIIALVQIPFVLHQLLVLVPARVGMGNDIVPIDVVAGTFGASFEGGGANAIMNAFLMIVIAGLVAGRQLGLVSRLQTWGFGAILLVPVLVNEAKVSVFYLLALFLVLFGSDLVKRPLRFLAAGLAAFLLLGALIVAYTLNAPDHERIEGWRDLVRYTYEHNIEKDEIGGKMSRFGALRFWAERHESSEWRTIVFGHGIGYTRVPDARAFPEGTVKQEQGGVTIEIDLKNDIGNTAVAALLWETGLLGLFCVFALLGSTFRTAERLERRCADRPERVMALRAARVGMLIIFVTLWHKNVLVLDVVYQTLVMLLIGYVAYLDRRTMGAAVQVGARPRASARPATRPGVGG
ncbi:hypothetical protein [Thiocystis violacea]|uniref:hypothetical protein n=1 Tax=Thiocystis violacea TaxID=13725 RepID=UPI0019031306|nr:hypothetical protein [Thiocystis violacea]MBK1720269.1 hypothetical protein [Thiocystis violacea]